MKREKFIVLCGAMLIALTGCGGKSESCDEGYQYSDGKCVKVCEEGYDLVGEECIKVLDEKSAMKNLVCQENFKLSDSGSCVLEETEAAKIDDPCPSGYKFANDVCTKTTVVDETVTKTCLDGGVLKSDHCEYTEIGKYGNIRQYSLHIVLKKSCPAGYKASNGKCSKTETTAVTGVYYCEHDGFLLKGKKCIKTTTMEPSEKYSCEEGYDLVDDNKCKKYEKVEESSTQEEESQEN